MEQLKYPFANTKGRIIEIQMLLRKVKITLSAQQLESLLAITTIYLVHFPVLELESKAHYLRIMNFYEKKLRPKRLSQSKKIKLSFDISVAGSLMVMIRYMSYQKLDLYERVLLEKILGEIDHQTI